MNVSNEPSGKVPKSKGKNINIPIGTSSDKNLVGLDSMQSNLEGTTEIKVYGNTQFTITQNADGTKTVKTTDFKNRLFCKRFFPPTTLYLQSYTVSQQSRT